MLRIFSATIFKLLSAAAWTGFVSSYFAAFADNCCWAEEAFAVEPFAVYLSKACNFVMNVADTLLGVSCLKLYYAFSIVCTAFFCAENLKTVPGALVAPVFRSLAVYLRNLFTALNRINNKVNVMHNVC